jgi:hypothetical protein
MTREDREMTDIVVVLKDLPDLNLDTAVAGLKAKGVAVSDIDAENGVIEGTIETIGVKGLHALEFVEYVRSVFSYTSEVSDAAVNGDEEDVDDAGA